MDKDEAMKLALEALEHWMRIDTVEDMHIFETVTAPEAIAVLRQAIEQPQTPDDLLRQSEREGWRYAKECEAEVKRLRQALEQPSDIEAAVKKENEACAEIAYSMAYSEDEAEEIAKAIRARVK